MAPHESCGVTEAVASTESSSTSASTSAPCGTANPPTAFVETWSRRYDDKVWPSLTRGAVHALARLTLFHVFGIDVSASLRLECPVQKNLGPGLLVLARQRGFQRPKNLQHFEPFWQAYPGPFLTLRCAAHPFGGDSWHQSNHRLVFSDSAGKVLVPSSSNMSLLFLEETGCVCWFDGGTRGRSTMPLVGE